MSIETTRTIIRDFKHSDLEDFNEYAKVKEVGQMAGFEPHEDIQDSRKILDEFIKNKTSKAIVYKENNKVIGSIEISEPLSFKEKFISMRAGKLDYSLSKDYWNRGIMTEVAKKVLEDAFLNQNFDIICVGHLIENVRSKRVVEKLGFTNGIETTFDNGKRGIVYKLTRNDYLRLANK